MKNFARNRNSQFFVIALIGLLGACNTNNRPEIQTEEIFEPTITESGVKAYEVVVTLLPPERPPRGGVRGGTGGNGGPPVGTRPGGNSRPPQANRSGGRPSMSSDQIDELIGEIIKETGYCREGYSELERMNEGEQIIVRGQCHEAATDDDISQFGTKDVRSIPD